MRESSEKRGGVLIIGASGQVGYHLKLAAERRGQPWRGTFCSNERRGMDRLDIRDARAVGRMVSSIEPEYLVAPAAVAHVDGCERDAPAAYRVNVAGTANLVQAANAVGATIVCFSSDYIFDGTSGPYDEATPANPISHYGSQKLCAEHQVLQCAHDALIVRTTVVYGEDPQGKNFVYRLLTALRQGREVAVPVDQIGTPTYAPALADAVFDLLAGGVRGVIHVAGRESVSRYEFACAAAVAFDEDPGLIRPVSTAELGQAARRPLRGGLRSARAEALLGRVLPGHVDGLHLFSAESALLTC